MSLNKSAFIMRWLLGAIIALGSLLAQSDRSTIRGAATDPTGAVVPKVEIVVTETSTNTIARTVITDDNGNYEIADLKPGVYRVKADAAGFKSSSHKTHGWTRHRSGALILRSRSAPLPRA